MWKASINRSAQAVSCTQFTKSQAQEKQEQGCKVGVKLESKIKEEDDFGFDIANKVNLSIDLPRRNC